MPLPCPPAGFKQIVTASLDKSLAVWTLEGVSGRCPHMHSTLRRFQQLDCCWCRMIISLELLLLPSGGLC